MKHTWKKDKEQNRYVCDCGRFIIKKLDKELWEIFEFDRFLGSHEVSRRYKSASFAPTLKLAKWWADDRLSPEEKKEAWGDMVDEDDFLKKLKSM